MKIYLKHNTANFFYAVDMQSQQVELCSAVGGKERVERYEGISSALQTGNVLITEQDYTNAKEYALRQLGLATEPAQQSEEAVPVIDLAERMRYKTDFLFSFLN